MIEQIGIITEDVIQILGLNIPANTPVFIGDSNYSHMERAHPDEFYLYGDRIDLIIRKPDYIGLSPSDGSIEYIKEFRTNNDLIKLAVRVSPSGDYYARTLYAINSKHIENAIQKGYLFKI